MSNQAPPVTFGSINEQNVYTALGRAKIDFAFQVPLDGGRNVRGGQVVDFIVYVPPRPIALYVQGKHWHGGKMALDDEYKHNRAQQMGFETMDITEDESASVKLVTQWIRKNIL